MPLSDEAFQRQVLADLAAIKASQAKDEKAFDVYRAKADELIQQQATNKQSLKDAHCRIDELRDDVQAAEARFKGMLAAEVSTVYRTAAIVGAAVSFVISVFISKAG